MDFIFLGGDKRMIYAAEDLSKKHNCCICGFGNDQPDILENTYDCAVLPLQKSKDGETIPTESGKAIKYSLLGDILKSDGIVFTGNDCPYLESLCYGKGYTLINYLEREELAVANAIPTAEGAIEIAINKMPTTLFGSEALVTGYGRIAKILAKYLTAFGSNVTVACRKKSDMKWAEINGCRVADITDKSAIKKAIADTDVIFNTVPYEIFDNDDFTEPEKKILYIELASKDGFNGELPNIEKVTARGLPGKTSPVTAGKIIAETIENILTERSDSSDA